MATTQADYDAANAKLILDVKDIVALLRDTRDDGTITRWLNKGAAEPDNPKLLHGFRLMGSGPWNVYRQEWDRFMKANGAQPPKEERDVA